MIQCDETKCPSYTNMQLNGCAKYRDINACEHLTVPDTPEQACKYREHNTALERWMCTYGTGEEMECENPLSARHVCDLTPGDGPRGGWQQVTIEELLHRVENEKVNHPAHYTWLPNGVEVIDITEHLNFCKGNAVKYICRAEHKGNEKEDLEKAKWYIERELERIGAS